MPRYVAFLRAINVGGHTVKMDVLRARFEDLGFGAVTTFIASGNVIFDAPKQGRVALERRIEGHLLASLGYDVATFVRTGPELVRLASYEPFAQLPSEGTTLHVGILTRAPAEPVRRRVERLGSDVDRLHLHGRELYWLRHGPLMESPLSGARLEKTLDAPMTMRNVSTVRKIAAKVSPSSG